MHDTARRSGDFGALLRVSRTAHLSEQNGSDEKRRLVAEFCRLLGPRQHRAAASALPLDIPSWLSPRLSQTLDGLLAGDSEKQIALKLSISPHTVHVYVKQLYKNFHVSSRGELLARFIARHQNPALAQ
jgi:DNA-binding NarL/FixJ family response regulator